MSRSIDTLPEPKTKAKVKVIVATASRTGTLSVYEAMKVLGYKPYHMVEVVLGRGTPHMEILTEAIKAQYDRFSGIKRYSRQDFDKWFTEYDCLVEIPYYMGPEVLEAYADDPDVKFILTDRDPDKWVTSMNNTAGEIVTKIDQFPLNVLKYFNQEVRSYFNLMKVLYGAIADGTVPGDTDNREVMRRNYVSYVKMAKRILPADRLLYFRLEDGLGWEQICPFLDMPIPNQAFPKPNDQGNFKRKLAAWLNPRLQSAMLKLGALLVPVTGSLVYFAIKHRSVFKVGR